MAPFGLKLWENAFQMIPNISFFGVEKLFSAKCFEKKIGSGSGGAARIDAWGATRIDASGAARIDARMGPGRVHSQFAAHGGGRIIGGR